MRQFNPILNAFIEDTCVLIVIAYLMARGKLLKTLFPERSDRKGKIWLGCLFGLVGISEVIFPGARAPYVAHTLMVTFAALLGDLSAGLIAVAIIALSMLLLQPLPTALETALTLFASALTGAAIRRIFAQRYLLLRGLIAGMCSQAGVIGIQQLITGEFHTTPMLTYATISIPANGFGALVLQLILNDARTRAQSEYHRLEAERAHSLVTEAQLTALRARVHPHFLFNALTSIAALCGIAPEKAESAILRLSQLMRRTLEVNATTPLCLTEEIEYVRGYLEIEQYRLGSRMRVLWEVDSDCARIQIPAFSLQTLVENAVAHGLAPKMEPGALRIVIRIRARHTLIAVIDDGVGMSAAERAKALGEDTRREHGLEIQSQQLMLMYG